VRSPRRVLLGRYWRREVAELRTEREILRRAAAYFRAGDYPVCRFRFVAEHQHVYGVKRLCRVLGVSGSGFYAWLGRPPLARSVSDAELAGMIVEIHDRSRRTSGAPRGACRAGSARAALWPQAGRRPDLLELALEGPRVMPCDIALPEISETFSQSGHITHLLAGEAASHAAGAGARR
jgi:hypothetical protein